MKWYQIEFRVLTHSYFHWPLALRVTWHTASDNPDIAIPTIHVDHPVLLGYSPTRDNA